MVKSKYILDLCYLFKFLKWNLEIFNIYFNRTISSSLLYLQHFVFLQVFHSDLSKLHGTSNWTFYLISVRYECGRLVESFEVKLTWGSRFNPDYK